MKPFDRRTTTALPRAELAPISTSAEELAPETRPALAEAKALARSAEDDIVTMTRCPLCAGGGMVPPEIAVVFDGLVAQAKANS